MIPILVVLEVQQVQAWVLQNLTEEMGPQALVGVMAEVVDRLPEQLLPETLPT